MSRISPELMGRLGWWYYRAAKYAEAEALLRQLMRARPGDQLLRNDLAWVELERNDFGAATQGFTEAEGFRESGFAQWNTPQMGLAVALWKSHRVEDALKNYVLAATAEPRWTNPVLVRAFYSPQVAQPLPNCRPSKPSVSKSGGATDWPNHRIRPFKPASWLLWAAALAGPIFASDCAFYSLSRDVTISTLRSGRQNPGNLGRKMLAPLTLERVGGWASPDSW